jgi:phage gp36-like protein
MTYATAADLDTKWGAEQVDLAALDPVTGARSAQRVEAALASATALMNGYFAKRYTLPIDAAPDGAILLRNVCCDLAMGDLSNTPGARNEIVKDAVEAARRFLSDVALGRADIPQNPTPGAPAPAVSPNEAIVAANDRAFTRTRLRMM